MEIKNGAYCVYVHTNKINGKMYIGQTCQKPEYRWNNGAGYKRQPYFYRAIRKYGWDMFEHYIIASNLTKQEADNFEKLLIQRLMTMQPAFGYNLTEGGEGSKGVKHLPRKRTEEQRRQISLAHKGIALSDAAKEKITGSRNYKAMPVIQLTMDDIFVNRWGCMMDASRTLNIPVQNICACCNKRRKTAGGFAWRHADE